MSTLRREVLARIDSDFPEADRAGVTSVLAREMERLASYGLQPGLVLPFYVVLLSRGNRALFDKYVRIVRGDDGDYRDILILGREQFPDVEGPGGLAQTARQADPPLTPQRAWWRFW